MPDRFGIPEEQVRYVQVEVYREQVIWLLFVAALLAIAPLSRFGVSWHFMTGVAAGPRIFGAIFATVALTLAVGIRKANDTLMGWSLFVGGITFWILAVFLGLGAITSTGGVLGFAFCIYPGRHMLIHSALFTSNRRR